MSIFYIDYVNGNDANSGADWANAWKTITNGATAARIAPGDEIRIAKSPDPTSIGNATWTNLSKTVTLATAQTVTVDNCETAWTAANGSTVTRQVVTTDAKEGSYCMQIAVDASPGTDELQAYYTIAETDFSAYQKLSFWIKNSTAIANATTWKLCLCSDDAGTTIVDTFFVIAIPSTNQWLPLTITKDGGGNLGASIKSIALYTSASTPTASSNVRLDNIIACTADGLNLQSLISKNSLAQCGDEGWYGLQSIVGTTILLDNINNTTSNAGKGYSGTTETITTYKRETIKTIIAASNGTFVEEIKDNGSYTNNILFKGGFNISNNIQDGETFLDGTNGYGYAITPYDKRFITIDHISLTRYYKGYNLNNSYIFITNCISISNCYYPVDIAAPSYFNIINIKNIINNSKGLYFNSRNTICIIDNINNNLGEGIGILGFDNKVKGVNCKNNLVGLYFTSTSKDNKVYDYTINNSVNYCIYYEGYKNILYNCNLLETTEATLTSYIQAGIYLFSQNHDNSGYNWIFTDGGTINSLASNRPTGTGIMNKFITTSSTRYIYYPLTLSIAKFAVNANKLVTFKAWMKKDHATNIGCRIVCKAYQIAGVTTDVITTKANDTDWEELTLTFTPTEAGVVEIEAQAYYIAGNSNAYIENVTITQAD